VFNRHLLDRVIDIAVQCLRHDLDDSLQQDSSLHLPRQTCNGSALSANHHCSSGALCSLFILASYCSHAAVDIMAMTHQLLFTVFCDADHLWHMSLVTDSRLIVN